MPTIRLSGVGTDFAEISCTHQRFRFGAPLAYRLISATGSEMFGCRQETEQGEQGIPRSRPFGFGATIESLFWSETFACFLGSGNDL